jgi:cationic peptide transport system ATP-binding protein
MFSVGQLQRVALARALILDPKVVVLDEALSSLDPSVRAQIVNLLLKLQLETGLTYILITHHLSLVRHISDQLVVLNKGEIVEYGATETIFQNPQSKVTQRLLSC